MRGLRSQNELIASVLDGLRGAMGEHDFEPPILSKHHSGDVPQQQFHDGRRHVQKRRPVDRLGQRLREVRIGDWVGADRIDGPHHLRIFDGVQNEPRHFPLVDPTQPLPPMPSIRC